MDKYDTCVLCGHVRCCHPRYTTDKNCLVPQCKCTHGVYSLLEYFWDIYMPAHTKPLTKLMHLAGLMSTLLYVILISIYASLFLLLATPFVVYPFAWSAHFFVEKNKPLAFKNPLYAKACDIMMCAGILTGFIKLDCKGRGR